MIEKWYVEITEMYPNRFKVTHKKHRDNSTCHYFPERSIAEEEALKRNLLEEEPDEFVNHCKIHKDTPLSKKFDESDGDLIDEICPICYEKWQIYSKQEIMEKRADSCAKYILSVLSLSALNANSTGPCENLTKIVSEIIFRSMTGDGVLNEIPIIDKVSSLPEWLKFKEIKFEDLKHGN